MGRLAMGMRALGHSSGFEVKVLKERPGPQRIKAWMPRFEWAMLFSAVEPILPMVLGIERAVSNNYSKQRNFRDFNGVCSVLCAGSDNKEGNLISACPPQSN